MRAQQTRAERERSNELERERAHLDDRGEVGAVGGGDGLVHAARDLLGQRPLVPGLEGVPQGAQLVQQTPDRPNVRLLVVRPPPPDLRRHVVRRSDLDAV